MFVMALPVAMSRSSSQPSPLFHHPRAFPDPKHSYCYCYGPTQRHEHHHYYSEVPPTVIKMEPQSQDDAQYQGYPPSQFYRSDWTATTTPPKPTTQQPIETISQVPDHRREQAADAMSAQGFHFEGYSNTNTNGFATAERNSADFKRASPNAGRHNALVSIKHGSVAEGLQTLLPNKSGDLNSGHLHPHEVINYDYTRHQPKKPRYLPSNQSTHFPSSIPNYFEDPNIEMSLTYESRQFMPDANYPQMQMHEPQDQEEIQHEHPRYPSPPMPSAEMHPYNPQLVDTTQEDAIENLPNLQANETDAPSPGRSKPIPKPDREVTKGENGRYVCTWAGCTEEVRDFGRKCEWSKHMDKHDRPYKCPAEGCEKLPGFTYSGGLLRHEREVHMKHGGPRKQLNCPHLNCKRHTGKGFSRQENLNEHLRRVHTSDGAVPDGAETEEEGSDSKVGMKRKRGSGGRGGGDDIREELKRLRAENEELRRHSEAQQAQTEDMMNQIRSLQATVTVTHPRMQTAPMM